MESQYTEYFVALLTISPLSVLPDFQDENASNWVSIKPGVIVIDNCGSGDWKIALEIDLLKAGGKFKEPVRIVSLITQKYQKDY